MWSATLLQILNKLSCSSAVLCLKIQGGSNMTGTDLFVNKPHCAAAVQCGLFTYKSVPVIFEPPCILTPP